MKKVVWLVLVVVCVVSMSSYVKVESKTMEILPWPGGKKIVTTRNSKEYGYQILAKGLYNLECDHALDDLENRYSFLHSGTVNQILYAMAINPKNGKPYVKDGDNLVTFNPDKTEFNGHTDDLIFDPQGNFYSGSLKLGFAKNHGKRIPVQLKRLDFPGAKANESMDVCFTPMQYDPFKKRLLFGGRIFEEIDHTAHPRGYTIFEIDPMTGKVYPVIEQRGDIELVAMVVSTKGDIFITISDNRADADDYEDNYSRQIVKLERR